MLNSPILEAAIGLVFVYLLFSLVVSAVNEAVLGHLVHLRAVVLEDSLKALLSGTGSKATPLAHTCNIAWRIVTSILDIGRRKPKATAAQPTLFADQLLAHPLVKGLASGGRNCPGYLPASTFADAVIGVLAGPAVVPPAAAGNPGNPMPANPPATASELVTALAALKTTDAHAFKLLSSVVAGAPNIAAARTQLEAWFNQSMDRVTGAYKRHTQLWLYLWSALIVLGLNVDTIELTKRLIMDSQFRTALADSATRFVNSTNVSGTNIVVSAEQLQKQFTELQLPLGWASCTNHSAHPWAGWVYDHLPVLRARVTINYPAAAGLVSGFFSPAAPCPPDAGQWLLKLFGLLVTIGAISQGAPFWFDLLNKLTNLRASGPPPKVSGKPA